MKDIKILMLLANLWDMNKYTVKKTKTKNFLRRSKCPTRANIAQLPVAHAYPQWDPFGVT
jgi:hypothetical protein